MIFRKLLIIVIALFASLLVAKSVLFSAPKQAEPPSVFPVTLHEEDIKLSPLVNVVEHLEDASQQLELTQVISTEWSDKFTASVSEDLNFGTTLSAWWLRFELRSESDKKWYLLVDAMLGGDFDVYVFPKQDVYPSGPKLLSGEQVKPLTDYRRKAWSLDLPRNKTYQVYVRATNGDSMLQLPVEFLTADEMLARSNWAYLLFGSCYLAMIVLAIYQFVNAVILREWSYAILGIFMLSMMFAFHRSNPAFSFPDFFNSTTGYFSSAPIAMMLASFMAFSRQALETYEKIPKVDQLFKAVIVASVAMLLLAGSFLYGKKVLLHLAIVVLLLVWFTSIYLACKGDKAARNFALVFVIPVAVQLPNAVLLIADKGDWKTFQDIAVVVSTLLFMFFITVVQAERIRKMREDMQHHKALSLITDKLAKYVSPQLYGEIFQGKIDAKLATHSRDLTIFFSDIVDFTYQSEQMKIDELAKWLNGYLNEMAQIALSRKGTIDKFIGDAIMIFYGDPHTAGKRQDAINCVRMAMAMQKKAHALGVDIRIGINSGPTIVGNFGAEDRMDYTVVGRSVNLAARLEQQSSPGRILISDSTYKLINKVIPCEERGSITVKGFEYPVKTYWVSQKS